MEPNRQYAPQLPALEETIDPAPLVVDPHLPITDVLNLMSANSTRDGGSAPAKRSSCVLVLENEKLVGILTERDIVRLTASEKSFETTTIADVMTRKIVTLDRAECDDVSAALSLMRDRHIRHLPIIKDGTQLVGLVTADSIRRVLQPANLLKLRQIKDVMSSQVIRAPENSSILRIAQLMSANRVSCVVIVQASERPVGIITERDIVQFQALDLTLKETQAYQVMSAPLFCLHSEDSLWRANEEMQRLKVRRLVIVGSRGELAGIITQTSMLKAMDLKELYGVIDTLCQNLNQQARRLQKINTQLYGEVTKRQEAEEGLRKINEDLEERIAERTAFLEKTNRRLRAEIDRRQAVEIALRESEERYRLMADNATDLIARHTQTGFFLYASPASQPLLGYHPNELIGRSLYEFLHPDDRATFEKTCKILCYEPDSHTLSYRTRAKNGNYIWMESTLQAVQLNDSGIREIVVVSRNITERKQADAELETYKIHLERVVAARTAELTRANQQLEQEVSERCRAEQALFEEKELAQVTLQSIGDAVITTDSLGRVKYLNPVAEELTGWTFAEAEGLPLSKVFKIIDETTRNPEESPVEQVLREGLIVGLTNPTLSLARDGTEYSIDCSAAPIRDRAGAIIGAVLIFHDVTHARTLTKKLTWQACHDALTGLVNRSEFERKTIDAIASAKEREQQHILCYLDLDQFKIVNDTCGHSAGDELLRQLADVLSQKVRTSDVLARLGGDEFGILLYQCPLSRAEKIANMLHQTIQKFCFTWQDKTFKIGSCIGLVEINSDSNDLTEVLSAADAACYAAKDLGRNRVHIYRSNDRELVKQRGERQWIATINQALETDRFVLYAQIIAPVDRLSEREVVRAEILVRMLDDSNDAIPPMAFIPAAERYGLMPAIDRWVIRTFFQRYSNSSWDNCAITAQRDRANCIYAINLSGMSLNDEQFLPFLKEQFDRYRVPPQHICFEITETAAIANLSRAVRVIRQLKGMGCRFALDDFGSGMSSFTYLKTLPVDYLKIDGHFVKNIVSNPIDRAMVDCINRIARVMGIQTVAEYVEDRAILLVLKELGVDYAQGYGIAMPRPLWLNDPKCEKDYIEDARLLSN
ncbi:EAL domain-containing protein [Lusitaniella coriacea LEGE 07157]|uniref:EAL domain-containing protein n=1 Tax=Lusitaniella coriacea LEGE 07157 TaxID=945747 RepID=A0A8J7ITL3_9CYAN|nr:EAL domain-containing protein [Lusitaniella coriacea]MBE9115933.1 EAL domain-containing protein [Lusitaniella coriacea LEGE 07157]